MQSMPLKKSTRSEIVHIVVTGYQKKKQPSKYYVFVIDVTWNNSERFEVYRRYSDLFSFQTTLKALFPGAAGRRNNEERVIPQLPKRIFVGRSHVARVAEARLEQINRYCQTLISLDPRLSESAHVVGFFSPRIGDQALPKLHLHRPASLHPDKIPLGSLFEDYCALAEYIGDDQSQVNFKAGDKVLVMSKDVSGWWMCGVDGKVGWAPPSYLKKCEDNIENDSEESDDEYLTSQKDKDSDDSGVGDNSAIEPTSLRSSLRKFVAPEITAEAYRAIDSYQANGAGQVSFETGDTIHVLDKLEDGWWFVSNGREEGWAPCSYLEGDKDEEVITNLEDAERYYTVDDYQAEEDDEISFKRGITLDVLQKSLDGWWVVKKDKVVGLAPATFLKKVEHIENDPAQSPSSQNAERKLTSSPPHVTSLSPFPAFQQPPRKQSVRARASLKASPGRSATKQPSPLSLPPANHPHSGSSPLSLAQRPPEPTPRPNPQDQPRRKSLETEKAIKPELPRRRVSEDDALLTPRPSAKPLGKDPLPAPRSPKIIAPKQQSTSPELSDSDPEENYTNFAFQQLALTKHRAHRSYSNASSRSSLSEKRPVATPRKCKSPSMKALSPPSIPPKPKDNEASPRPPLPPRPVVSMQLSLPVEPERPMRPRKSEIKRAKDRARAANPKNKSASPKLMVVDEDGYETRSMVSTKSSQSSASYTSSKSAPVAQKERRNTDAESTKFLIPETAHNRQRRRSANDELYNKSPRELASSAPGGTGGDLMEGGINTQVADTLLKYIMSSEDPGLKAALRDLIIRDSEVAGSIHSNQ